MHTRAHDYCKPHLKILQEKNDVLKLILKVGQLYDLFCDCLRMLTVSLKTHATAGFKSIY